MLLCNVALLQASVPGFSDFNSYLDDKDKLEFYSYLKSKLNKCVNVYRNEKDFYKCSRERLFNVIKESENLKKNNMSNDEKRQKLLSFNHYPADYVRLLVRRMYFIYPYNDPYNETSKILNHPRYTLFKSAVNDETIEHCINLMISASNKGLQQNDERYRFFAHKMRAATKTMNPVVKVETCIENACSKDTCAIDIHET